MLTQAPRGTKDVLPAESHQWQWLEEHIAAVCNAFGYREIRTPVFEHTELFERGVGDTTDVVQKEMYTFDDKGGRSITLRPEGTASVGRAYLEHNLYADIQPCKLFYNITTLDIMQAISVCRFYYKIICFLNNLRVFYNSLVYISYITAEYYLFLNPAFCQPKFNTRRAQKMPYIRKS